MVNADHPTCFISYSHTDRPIAEDLTKLLQERGLDVWIDVLELLPGDSLVGKIFEEGLKECQVFIILLSPTSVRSEWVRHELDVALVNRLNKITRVIPVIAADCEVPVALRSIVWVNLKDGFERAADLITNAAYRRTPEKNFHEPPKFIQRSVPPRAGLSQEAASVAAFLASMVTTSDYPCPQFRGEEIKEGTGLPEELVNDAVDELEANGLVKVWKFLGTGPYDFGMLQPTYALAYTFSDYVRGEVDPEKDVLEVAAVIASLKEADGRDLAEKLAYEPNRINFAVNYLRDYGLVKTFDFMGTAPYDFGRVIATRNTRQFVEGK